MPSSSMIQKDENLRKAYQMVLDDMVAKGPGMFVGTYDALHGDKHFMYGVNMVMEYLAFEAGVYENFSTLFLDNMGKSERVAHLLKKAKDRNNTNQKKD